MLTDLKNLILDVLANDSQDLETFEDKWNELNQYLIDSKQSERGFVGRLIKSCNTQGLIPDGTAIQYLHFIEDLNSKRKCTTPTIEFKKTSKTQTQQIDAKPWIVYKTRELAISKLSTKELEAMDKAVSSVKIYLILENNITKSLRNCLKALKVYKVNCLRSYKFCLDLCKYAEFVRGVRRLEILRFKDERDGFRKLLKNCIAKQSQILPTQTASHFLLFTLKSLVINKVYEPTLNKIHTYKHQASHNLTLVAAPPPISEDLLQFKLLFKTLNSIWLKRAYQAYKNISSFKLSPEQSRVDHQLGFSYKNKAPRPSILRKHDTLKKYKLVFSLMKIIESRARFLFERLKLYNIYYNQQNQLISPKYQNLVSKVEKYRHLYLIFVLVRVFNKNLRIGFIEIAKASQNTSMARPMTICVKVDQYDEIMPSRLARTEQPLQFSEPEESLNQVSFGINSQNPNLIEISEHSQMEEAKSHIYESEELKKLKLKFLLATLSKKINKTRRDAFSTIKNHQKSMEELNQFKANIISQAQLRSAHQSKEALKKITLSHTVLILSNKLSTIQQSALDRIKSQYHKPSSPDLNESYTSSYSQHSRRYLPLTLLMILSYIAVGIGAYLYFQTTTPSEPEPPFLIRLNDQTFPAAISENEYVSVFLSKNWCTKCLSPFAEYKKAAKYFSEEGSGIFFTYIKEEKITDLEAQYQINTFPSLLFFHNGQLISKQTSKIDSKELVSKYNEIILE
jgi:hypothetical protein